MQELLEAADSYRVQSKGSAAFVQTAALHQKKDAKASKAARATPAAVPPLHMWEIALADDSPNEDARDEASEEWTRVSYVKLIQVLFCDELTTFLLFLMLRLIQGGIHQHYN